MNSRTGVAASPVAAQSTASLLHIPALLQFLHGLAENNSRSWFLHNKPQHEILHLEFTSLIDSVGARVRKFDPLIEPFDAAKAVYRIHRDVRFSNDKTPYKTHMGGVIGTRNVSDKSRPIYYFQIDHLGILTVTAGIYLPPAEVLKKIRAHILNKPALLSAVLADRQFLKSFNEFSIEDALIRMPAGYPSDHPHAALIKNRHFMVEARVDVVAIPSKDLVSAISMRFEAALPMMTWLRGATV